MFKGGSCPCIVSRFFNHIGVGKQKVLSRKSIRIKIYVKLVGECSKTEMKAYETFIFKSGKSIMNKTENTIFTPMLPAWHIRFKPMLILSIYKCSGIQMLRNANLINANAKQC